MQLLMLQADARLLNLSPQGVLLKSQKLFRQSINMDHWGSQKFFWLILGMNFMDDIRREMTKHDMTNQFTQTGLRTFNWKQLFTQPWWWLPLRSSKHQSPLLKTVLLRTTLPWTIKLHYYMSLLGSNHLLYCKYYSPLKNSSCLKFKVDLKMCKNCLFAIKVDFNFYFSDS